MGRKQKRRRKRPGPDGAGGGPTASKDILSEAMALHKKGRLAAALGLYRQVPKNHPDRAQALNLAGMIASRGGNPPLGVELLQTAISIKPGFAEAHNNLGIALGMSGCLDEAAEAFRRALEFQPDFAEAYNNLGSALKDQGRLEEALEAYDHAGRIRADFADPPYNAGSTLAILGRLEESEVQLRRALRIKPTFVDAHRSLAQVKTYTPNDPDLRVLENLLGHSSVAEAEKTKVHFVLAKAYEDVGEWDRAFEHMEKGNRLFRTTFHNDSAGHAALVEGTMKVFGEDLARRLGGKGFPSEKPIFILGMPRSGTTLVEQILASHSMVHGAGEIMDLVPILKSLSDGLPREKRYPNSVPPLKPERLREMGRAYTDAIAAYAPAARYVINKTPINFLYLGLIRLMLPNARIIHCVRNPIDTCLSCYKVLFGTRQNYAYDLKELGEYYRLYSRLMDHWKAVMPGPVLEVSYEDVIAGQEKQTRRILDFCDLPWEDGCLEFYQSNRPVKTASLAQVRQPLYTGAVDKWRRYESHLAPLLEALGQ